MTKTSVLFRVLLCSSLVVACGHGDDDASSDGTSSADTEPCSSGPTVCEDMTTKQSKYCSDCQDKCINLLGADCNIDRNCSNSCEDVDCDDDEKVRCAKP